jgi:hypothetical protein
VADTFRQGHKVIIYGVIETKLQITRIYGNLAHAVCTRLSFPYPENEPGIKLSFDLNYAVEAQHHGVLPLGLLIWLSTMSRSEKLNIYSAHAQTELSAGHTLHY